MRSSYKENNYGSVLQSIVLTNKPQRIVECGVLDGYSTYHIALAVRFNCLERATYCDFRAYDLWDEYEYKHGDYNEVKYMLNHYGLNSYVKLEKGDAFKIAHKFKNGWIDFLHMDISNDGDTLKRTLEAWGDKISTNGIIAFEGGSKERDEGWIKEYDKKPIRPELFKVNDWFYTILDPFPGLTLLWKKQKQ